MWFPIAKTSGYPSKTSSSFMTTLKCFGSSHLDQSNLRKISPFSMNSSLHTILIILSSVIALRQFGFFARYFSGKSISESFYVFFYSLIPRTPSLSGSFRHIFRIGDKTLSSAACSPDIRLGLSVPEARDTDAVSILLTALTAQRDMAEQRIPAAKKNISITSIC